MKKLAIKEGKSEPPIKVAELPKGTTIRKKKDRTIVITPDASWDLTPVGADFLSGRREIEE